jgi:hypothetical protein
MRFGGSAVVTVSCALMLSASVADAQQVREGEVLLGTLVSASATAPNQGDPVTVFEVPARGAFALTQVCVFSSTSADALEGQTFGSIARAIGDASTEANCTTYEPGLALPRGEVLSFQDTQADGADAVVTITGILSNR